MIKPKRLKYGSKIAVISPSNGLPFLFPGNYELGLQMLREVLGFEVIEMPTARMAPADLYKNPQMRADDINQCFLDDSIDGIITSIGGYESVRILPYLNVENILKNPKMIMGTSDPTTFLSYLNYLGLVTFYGPTVMAGFAQTKHLPEEYVRHLKYVFFEHQFPYRYEPFPRWTNGYKDWSIKETLGECTEFYENENGWTFLQGDSISEGQLWGGCIEVLEFIKSTKYWPDEYFWKDKVLFFETSEEKPSPSQVGYMLRNYGTQGIFDQINGVVFGRAKDYTPHEKEELNETVLRIIKDEFGVKHIPIVVDMDFGHTDPKLILPLGCRIQLNPKTKEIVLMENPFESSE
ncbi:S66 family peptidase [Chengkuizengella axinellae]|uniref:LD-carboxypeptidase n=1 Tax=Chengkuizengella axinellae TaxID=3064388 RepID=A0ABT9IUC6_9BACL|nr:S66 peptidase family protein [Chengkuizengella sp. 2205SS18-9]MDP5272907.1 LD-carboxypeptidase [Chengkuizengella sp. 2205SS18-9]